MKAAALSVMSVSCVCVTVVAVMSVSYVCVTVVAVMPVSFVAVSGVKQRAAMSVAPVAIHIIRLAIR